MHCLSHLQCNPQKKRKETKFCKNKRRREKNWKRYSYLEITEIKTEVRCLLTVLDDIKTKSKEKVAKDKTYKTRNTSDSRIRRRGAEANEVWKVC